MGLRAAIARTAAGHAHALVVEAPGSWRTRVATERAVTARGWRLAVSPADADVLVVCGAAGPQLAKAVEVVWHQMPGPRVRVDVPTYDEVAARLDQAHAALLDTDHHRHDARHRPDASDPLAARDQDGTEDHGGHEGMEHGGHEGHDDMEHGGHEGHGDMDMSPGGIPLAEGGEDRDGLEMDVLTVHLGPVLPHWPAGLVVRCSLQGDVVATARAETVDGSQHHDHGLPHGARSLDNVASLLALAGWDDAAGEARGVRDALLDGGSGAAARTRLERLRSRVVRSRVLRWSLRGLRPLGEEDVGRVGLPDGAAGDTYDRLVRMLERAGGPVRGPAAEEPARWFSTDHVARLVTGLDLAAARLVVASLDIHAVAADHRGHEVAHG